MKSDRALWETTAQTFETLCYLSPTFSPDQGDEAEVPDGGVMVWVPFMAAEEGQEDPFGGEGAMTLFIHGDALVELAVHQMLGIDEASDIERRDGVGEMANVLCGKVLGERAGNYVFNLGHPSLMDGDVPPFPIDPHELGRARLAFDEGILDVVFYVARAQEAAA